MKENEIATSQQTKDNKTKIRGRAFFAVLKSKSIRRFSNDFRSAAILSMNCVGEPLLPSAAKSKIQFKEEISLKTLLTNNSRKETLKTHESGEASLASFKKILGNWSIN